MKNKTFDKWLKRVNNTKTAWTEHEIKYFRKAIGPSGKLPEEKKQELLSIFNENAYNKLYRITRQQAKAGREWLKRTAFKINGAPRNSKDNPFGHFETQIISEFSHFEFVGLYDVSNLYGGATWYLPVYRVCAKDGSYFDYLGCREAKVINIG